MNKFVNLFFIFLLLLSACRSPLSNGKVEELSAIRAEIDISQEPTDQKVNYATVRLFDKDGKQIANKGIKINVNGIPLAFTERQELYYTTTTSYITDSIPVSDTYIFEAVLTDGKSYFLGRIAPLEETQEDDIQVTAKGKFEEDAIITWSNLKEVNQLSISKSVLLKTSTKNELKYDYEPVVTRQINGSGRYVVPKVSYSTDTSIVSALEIKFMASKSGEVNTDLLKGSVIRIHGEIEKRIEFDE